MSASTAPAIPTASSARRSRSGRASSTSRTHSTRCSRRGSTAPHARSTRRCGRSRTRPARSSAHGASRRSNGSCRSTPSSASCRAWSRGTARRSFAPRKPALAVSLTCSTIIGMPQKPRFRAVAAIDPGKLAEFQAGIRKRYSDEQILAELRACADRLGKSPTMREFAGDAESMVHPQTVIEHFGSWNVAKRAAGLVPRRFATRDELLGLLRELGDELGRPPTARDIDEHKGRLPSKSLYWHTFGSLANALREAGFDVAVGVERLERAVEQGAALARRLGRLPKFADWAEARKEDDSLLTEWQVYRMLDARRGAWSTFQFLVRERLDEQGVRVSTDGRLLKKKR